MTQKNISPSVRAAEARERIAREAAEIGIDRAYISVLVDTFYDRIRQHKILGPIFNEAIKDNWPNHLATMKKFWASVALNAGEYSGKPVPAHRKHDDTIQDWHFGVWLGLFQQTLEDTAPSKEAETYFMIRAERIANSLKLAMFGTPELGKPRYE